VKPAICDHYQFPAIPYRELLGQSCAVTNLVAEALGGDDSNFIADTLVGLEVEGELWVVTPANCGD
jgi:hypothetical protein